MSALSGYERVASRAEGYLGGSYRQDSVIRDEVAITFRNAVNHFARDSRANSNIHYASKFAVLGAFVSVVGALESVARLVSVATARFFFGVSENAVEYEETIGNIQNLLGYHLTNIATLGFFGHSIRDEAYEREESTLTGTIKHEIRYSPAFHWGDEYGLVDLVPKAEI